MESVGEGVDGIPNRTFDVPLSSGSVYIRNSIRYNYSNRVTVRQLNSGEGFLATSV